MVSHQAVGQHPTLGVRQVFAKQLQIQQPILVIEKHGFPVSPSLGNMIRQTGRHHSCISRHHQYSGAMARKFSRGYPKKYFERGCSGCPPRNERGCSGCPPRNLAHHHCRIPQLPKLRHADPHHVALRQCGLLRHNNPRTRHQYRPRRHLIGPHQELDHRLNCPPQL